MADTTTPLQPRIRFGEQREKTTSAPMHASYKWMRGAALPIICGELEIGEVVRKCDDLWYPEFIIPGCNEKGPRGRDLEEAKQATIDLFTHWLNQLDIER